MATTTVERDFENKDQSIAPQNFERSAGGRLIVTLDELTDVMDELIGAMRGVQGCIATERVERPKARKAGFFSRVAYELWRATVGLSFSAILLPVGPAIRDSKTLSLKEKTEIEASLMGL